jgi:hypothetical protein
MTMTISVSLNTSVNPPVTCDPPIKDKDRGHDTVTWKPASGEKFAFASLSMHGNPACFGTPNVQNNKITISDNNSGGSSVGEFPYTLTVTLDGKTYSTAGQGGPGAGEGDPMIRNK